MYDMTRRSRPRRGRRPLPETERKARLVQARVDEELDEVLKKEARERRTTVSQLIRNVLESTFQLVDDIVSGTATLTQTVRRDARRIAASAQGEPPAARTPGPPDLERDALDGVVAWQEVVVARPARCARCGSALRRGTRALTGLSDTPSAPRAWLCLACAPRS
jgi:hypothetical protein